MKSNKFDWKLAICISLFSFANYVTQPLYSAFVPVLLSKQLSSTTKMGIILSVCNLLAMLIHPVIGGISDHTRCRFGRRRPYILSGAVLCGVSFMLLPWLDTLWQFAIMLICYSIAVAYWKAPVGAIQIDCVKPEYVTRSNAVASCVLALSSVFAYFLSNSLSTSNLDERWVFMLGGIMTIVTAVIGCVTVHEQDSRQMVFTKKKKGSVLDAFLTLETKQKKNMMIMLFAILFAFIANYGFEYFFVLFSEEKLGFTVGQATLYLAVYMLSYFAAALWFICRNSRQSAGTLSCFSVGISGLICFGFFGMCFLNGTGLAITLWIVCIFYGVCWGTFNIFIYPLWLKFQEGEHSGNLMGLYFVCTGFAGTIMPTLYGMVHDLSGTYVSVFAFCGSFFFLAFVLLRRINNKK